MGLGDQIMATGMAKGAKARGKRIAFGDGHQIIWDHHSEQIFRNNPNIAPPGSERDGDLEWIPFYRGHRVYNTQRGERWIWNDNFKAIPGEIFLDEQEQAFGKWQCGNAKGFVVVEPNVPFHKGCAPNKQWPVHRYESVVRTLRADGYDVVQLIHSSGHRIARQIKTTNFRQALSVLQHAALYIGPEGGLHHGSAALGIPAVVLFGGFIPPAVTGYDFHTNLTGGAKACGSLTRCNHCVSAMNGIKAEHVLDAARKYLESK